VKLENAGRLGGMRNEAAVAYLRDACYPSISLVRSVSNDINPLTTYLNPVLPEYEAHDHNNSISDIFTLIFKKRNNPYSLFI
jgi:hypothetical protein